MDIKAIPVRAYFSELEAAWAMLEARKVKGNHSKEALEVWAHWSHEFNMNQRAIFTDARRDKTIDKYVFKQFHIISHGLFSMWQLQYKMARAKVGIIVGRKKLAKLQKEYNALCKETIKQIWTYEALHAAKETRI